jgi:hypothetical protein
MRGDHSADHLVPPGVNDSQCTADTWPARHVFGSARTTPRSVVTNLADPAVVEKVKIRAMAEASATSKRE